MPRDRRVPTRCSGCLTLAARVEELAPQLSEAYLLISGLRARLLEVEETHRSELAALRAELKREVSAHMTTGRVLRGHQRRAAARRAAVRESKAAARETLRALRSRA